MKCTSAGRQAILQLDGNTLQDIHMVGFLME